MLVFIICVCLGVIVTFFFVMKFIINQYCKRPKRPPHPTGSYRGSSNSRVSIVTLPTISSDAGSSTQSIRPFLPAIHPIYPQPYIMTGGVAMGEGTSSASFCLYPDVMEDTFGHLITAQESESMSSSQQLMDVPPSYDDLFPVAKRELDTIMEE